METNLCSYHFTMLVLVFNGVDLVSPKSIYDFQHQIEIKPNDLQKSRTKTESMNQWNFTILCSFISIHLHTFNMQYLFALCIILKKKTIHKLPSIFFNSHEPSLDRSGKTHFMVCLVATNDWGDEKCYTIGVCNHKVQSTSEKYKNLMQS